MIFFKVIFVLSVHRQFYCVLSCLRAWLAGSWVSQVDYRRSTCTALLIALELFCMQFQLNIILNETMFV